MNKNNDVFLILDSLNGLPESPVVGMDVGVVDGGHTAALFTRHEHLGEVIALSPFGRPRFNPKGGQRIEIIEINEASNLPEYAEIEKLVIAHLASGAATRMEERGAFGIGRPRNPLGRTITEQVADALGVPRPFMTQEWSGAAMALRQFDSDRGKSYAWMWNRLVLSRRLGNKFHDQDLPKQKPRKRRSGNRLVSKNERRARSR